jgi:hypothetical protein
MIIKNDYVFYIYDNEKLMARVISINGDKARIEVCLSARRGEDTLLDEIEVNISELEKINKFL